MLNRVLFCSLAGTLLAIALFTGCKKDITNPAGITAGKNDWMVTDAQYQQAFSGLKTEKERQFFDFSYASRNNLNIKREASGRDNNEFLIAVATELIRIQGENPAFINSLLTQFGYPMWDQSWVLVNQASSDSTVALIPMASISADSTSAFIMASWSNSNWYIRVYSKQGAGSLTTQGVLPSNYRFIMAAFCQMDNQIFSQENTIWLDMLSDSTKFQVIPADLSGYDLIIDWSEVTDEFRDGTEVTDRDKITAYRFYNYWSNYASFGGTGGGSGGGWGSGSGNGTGGTGGGNGGGGGGTGNNGLGTASPEFITFLGLCMGMDDPDGGSGGDLTAGEESACHKLLELQTLMLISEVDLEVLFHNGDVLNTVLNYLHDHPNDPNAQQIVATIASAIRWGALTQSQASQLMQLVHSLNLTTAQVSWLIDQPSTLSSIHSFVVANPTSQAAGYASNIIKLLTQFSDLVWEEFEVLYLDYLQNPTSLSLPIGSTFAGEEGDGTTTEISTEVLGDNPDCESWNFQNVGPSGNYKACGVSGLYMDFWYLYQDLSGDINVGKYTTTFRNTWYFEMPGGYSPGSAANLCAGIFKLIEEQIEAEYGGARRPTTPMEETALENTITNRLKLAMEATGGRFTKNNNYNTASSIYKTSLTQTYCQ